MSKEQKSVFWLLLIAAACWAGAGLVILIAHEVYQASTWMIQ